MGEEVVEPDPPSASDELDFFFFAVAPVMRGANVAPSVGAISSWMRASSAGAILWIASCIYARARGANFALDTFWVVLDEPHGHPVKYPGCGAYNDSTFDFFEHEPLGHREAYAFF